MERILALLLSFSALLHAAELYEVRLHRPNKAGEKFNVSLKAVVDSTMSFSANDRVIRESKVDASCEIEGELEIVEVDARGKVSAAKLKISKSDGKVEGRQAQVFKPGDVISAGRGEGDKEDIQINGEKPSETQAELAKVMMPTERKSKVTDDDILGPGKSVGVGEEWQMNAKAAAEDLAELGKFQPGNIKGTVKLTGVTDVAGQKCLRLLARSSVAGSGFPIPDAPPWLTVKALSVEMDLDGDFPVDAAVHVPRSKITMMMDLSAGGELDRDGEVVRFSMSGHRKQTIESQVKPAK